MKTIPWQVAILEPKTWIDLLRYMRQYRSLKVGVGDTVYK